MITFLERFTVFLIVALVLVGQLEEAAYDAKGPRPKRKIRRDSKQ